MPRPQKKDILLRRVVMEYGRVYCYVYLADSNGKVLEEECFEQPFELAQREVAEEAKEAFDQCYQWAQDTILWYATARDEPEESDSEDTDKEE